MTSIYLDHNATTPMDGRVLAAMQPFQGECFGNPSSQHWAGRRTADAIKSSRVKVARRFGAKPSEVLFTSGGTESLSTALRCSLNASQGKVPHVIVSAVEHPALLEPCHFLEQCGVMRLTVVGVDSLGRISVQEIVDAVTEDTTLVAVMSANNETGNLYDTRAIAQAVRLKNPRVLMLVDAVQAAGKIDLTFESSGADLLVLSGHKIYGPMGVGALLIRHASLDVAPWLMGGPQENGRRGGTENVPAIVGFGAACEITCEMQQIQSLTQRLKTGIESSILGTHLNGDPATSLPGTLNLRFDDVDGEDLLIQLDLAGIAASTGSACASGTNEPSHVLLALGLTPQQVHQSLRFSLGRGTTEMEIDAVIELLPELVSQSRK